MEAFIKAINLSFSFDSNLNEKLILKNLNFSIKKGEFIAILGHNGCGKSTLAKLFNALLLPTQGELLIENQKTNLEENQLKIRKKVGLVLQNPENQIVASLVEEDVAFGPENLGFESSEIKSRVQFALEAVGLSDHRQSLTYNLSGGQKQRLAIAGVLAMKPQVIVLDEPTSMLDPCGRDDVMKVIKHLNKKLGITIILITHYMEEAIVADRIFIMSEGEILLKESPKKVFSKVDFLKQLSLQVPASTELLHNLKANGFENIPEGIIDKDNCIKVLVDCLEENLCPL